MAKTSDKKSPKKSSKKSSRKSAGVSRKKKNKKSPEKSAPSTPGKKSFKWRLITWALILVVGGVGLTALPVLVYRFVDPLTTPLMWIRWAESDYEEGRPLFLTRWVPIEEISPRLVRAVLSSEDQKFFKHNGFDWVAVNRAIQVNMKSKKKIGASTITMQTAKNVFLWQDRNWLRKGLEAYFTVLIEALWSKERILEVYFNIIEWGDGTFGCESAAQKYFHHSARDVSPVESAWMAAILPNPRLWSTPDHRWHVQGRQMRILTTMRTLPLSKSLPG